MFWSVICGSAFDRMQSMSLQGGKQETERASEVFACARVMFGVWVKTLDLVPDDALGFSHASAFPLRRFFVVSRSLHIADQALFLAQLFETPNHLLNGLA
jgi:hypothetical protein